MEIEYSTLLKCPSIFSPQNNYYAKTKHHFYWNVVCVLLLLLFLFKKNASKNHKKMVALFTQNKLQTNFFLCSFQIDSVEILWLRHCDNFFNSILCVCVFVCIQFNIILYTDIVCLTKEIFVSSLRWVDGWNCGTVPEIIAFMFPLVS